MKHAAFLVLLAIAASAAATLLTPPQEAFLRALARQQPLPQWEELSGGQLRALEANAEAQFEDCRAHHMPDGMIVSVEWTDRGRGEVRQYHDTGDSALWTGIHLGMLAYRNAVLGDAASRDAMRDALDVLDRLTLVSGRPGYVPRYCGRYDAALYPYLAFEGENPGGTPVYRGAPPYEDFFWQGGSSRDMHDGVRFGLAAVWALSDDPETRARAAMLVERIMDRLVEDHWRIVDGQGDRTRTTPGWRAAWFSLARAVNPERYDFLAFRHALDQCGFRLTGLGVRSRHARKYYPNHLRFTRLATIALAEQGACRRARAVTWIRRNYAFRAEDHLNAYFAAVYLTATGDVDHVPARATVQGMLADYPAPPRWSAHWPEGSRAELEGRRPGFADHALLAREQVVRDSIWQRPPTVLYGGRDLVMTYPGLDLLLPYWMGRHAGVLAVHCGKQGIEPSSAPR